LTDKNLLILVLFGFLNIKSVKIYAIPFIFSTTLLLFKLDTLLLKKKNLPVLDITGFFFRIRTQVTALVLMHLCLPLSTHAEKNPVISNTGRFFCFNSDVSYTCFYLKSLDCDINMINILFIYNKKNIVFTIYIILNYIFLSFIVQ